MAKQSGLGDAFYMHGRDISGDVGSVGTASGGPAALEVTGIDKSAIERLGGYRTGTIEFSAFFNDASNQEHAVLSILSTGQRHVMYCRGTSMGSPAACMVARQINYDPTRGADGSLTIAVQALSDTYGLEWGELLTAGIRTDTGATTGTSLDTLTSAAFGGQAYLQVFPPFTGTDGTVKIQDSADNSAWADVATFAFATTTGASNGSRASISNTATIRRYVRATTTTSAGFTSFSFAVALVKNRQAGTVF